MGNKAVESWQSLTRGRHTYVRSNVGTKKPRELLHKAKSSIVFKNVLLERTGQKKSQASRCIKKAVENIERD